MCLLTTALGLTGVAAGIVGALEAAVALGTVAMSIASPIMSAKSQEAQNNYQAQVAENNEKIANQKAKAERQQGLEDARSRKLKAVQQVAQQKAGIASNGIDVTSESALDTIENTAMVGELDALTIQYNAEQKALNYEAQADNFANQSNLYKFSAQNAMTQGTIDAVSGGLNSTMQIGSMVSGSFRNKPTNNKKETL